MTTRIDVTIQVQKMGEADAALIQDADGCPYAVVHTDMFWPCKDPEGKGQRDSSLYDAIQYSEEGATITVGMYLVGVEPPGGDDASP